MGFDIMSLQKGRGPVQARSKADEGRAVLKYIDVDDLVPSEDNFYSMSAINELATLIELSDGVKQPALVVPMGGGKYKVIAGHRRRLASIQLVKQGKEAYRKIPCMVEADEREQGADADELRAIDEAILLITTNGQREKTDWDKVQEATRLRELLDQKRRFEKIPGETRKLIAEQLGTTPAQIGRYDSIAKHLITALKEWLKQGKIGISVAYELSISPEDAQQLAVEERRQRPGPITIDDVRRWRVLTKWERQKATPKGVAVVMTDEVGPAPTPDQMNEIVKRAKDHPASGAVEVRRTEPVKAGSAEDIWTRPENAYVRTEPTKMTTVPPDGIIVDFPAPPSPPQAKTATEPKKEPMNQRRAAYILEDLQMYCEEMLAIEADLADRWMERADALAVAIAALRK